MPVILAKSSRQKSCYRTDSLTRCEIVSARLAGFEFAKALELRCLSAFAFKAITLRNFEKKLYEAYASAKQNTGNTIKQLISSKLDMNIQSER